MAKYLRPDSWLYRPTVRRGRVRRRISRTTGTAGNAEGTPVSPGSIGSRTAIVVGVGGGVTIGRRRSSLRARAAFAIEKAVERVVKSMQLLVQLHAKTFQHESGKERKREKTFFFCDRVPRKREGKKKRSVKKKKRKKAERREKEKERREMRKKEKGKKERKEKEEERKNERKE